VRGLTGGIEHLLKKNKVEYVKGAGVLTSVRGEVRVGERSLRGKHIIIATGSEPTPIPPCPVDNAAGRIVDSTGALALKTVPATMAVIGGGVIGVEYATIFSALDVKVTIIEPNEILFPFLDRELVDEFIHDMRDRGMSIRLQSRVKRVSRQGEACLIELEDSRQIWSEMVLFAAGRQGATAALDAFCLLAFNLNEFLYLE
jgi:pyruvate/2-oxoglutarate dehydrogenase complex dihydrolipoamide dehydrogenase (E3) component